MAGLHRPFTRIARQFTGGGRVISNQCRRLAIEVTDSVIIYLAHWLLLPASAKTAVGRCCNPVAMDESSTALQPVEVTLVHGTFARGAAWTQPGSRFQRELQRELKFPTIFNTFEWSGANSHSARKTAGGALAKHLRSLGQAHPDRHHILLAHSHGGNVACYALEDVEAAKNVSAIVTLGTPFITCRGRSIGGISFFLAIVFLDVLSLLVALLLAVGASVFFPFTVLENLVALVHGSSVDWLLVVYTACQILVVLVIWPVLMTCIGKKRLPARLITWLQRRQSSIVCRLQMPRLGNIRIFAVGAEADEAGALLTLLHRISNASAWLFYRVSLSRCAGTFSKGDPEWNEWDEASQSFWFSVYKVFLYPVAAVLGTFSLFFGLVGLSMLVGSLELSEKAVSLVLMAIPLGLYALLFLLALIAQGLMLIVPTLVRAHRLGFGGESPLVNWLTDIRAVADPDKVFPSEETHCAYLTVPKALLRGDIQRVRLWHSQLYRSDNVIHAVVAWLNCVYSSIGHTPSRESVGQPSLATDCLRVACTSLTAKVPTTLLTQLGQHGASMPDASPPVPVTQVVDESVFAVKSLPGQTLKLIGFIGLALAIHDVFLALHLHQGDHYWIDRLLRDILVFVGLLGAFRANIVLSIRSILVLAFGVILGGTLELIFYEILAKFYTTDFGSHRSAAATAAHGSLGLSATLAGICIGLHLVRALRLQQIWRILLDVFLSSLAVFWCVASSSILQNYFEQRTMRDIALLIGVAFALARCIGDSIPLRLLLYQVPIMLAVGYLADMLTDAGFTLAVGVVKLHLGGWLVQVVDATALWLLAALSLIYVRQRQQDDPSDALR
jgi:Alpha/beta hydrolase